MSIRDQLNSYIQQLENRLRLGALFRGAAILTSVALAATVILVLIANAFAFSRGSITGARVALLFALTLAVVFGIALPLYALTRRRTAREAEAAFPQFQQRLLTFAERDAAAGFDVKSREPFIDLLAADALGVARTAEPAQLVPGSKLLTFLGVGAASLGVLAWLILAGPGYLGHGAAMLWAATPNNEAAPFYDIKVTPGDSAVRRNADQLVTAQLVGLQTDAVHLYARYQSTAKWEQVPMHPQAGVAGYQFVFAGIPESVEYYVEAGPLRSRHYNIRVLDLAEVKNIRVTYHYPDWTHLQNVVEERGGDLRAVEGTEANLEIQTDRPLRDGLLVLDDQRQIQLTGGEGNVYKGTIKLEKDGVFHVAALDQGQPVRLSGDYFIEARQATPPNIIIAKPGQDYRSNPIEEVTVAVKADGEFGIYDMALHYSVNGGPEQTVDLLKQKGAKQADGSTIINLENFKMVPGDLVSLYATAKDSRAESRTDITFIQAEPFEREFSQSQAAGGGGGGGGGGQADQNDISQREKEIISSTWKQNGDKKTTKEQAAEAAKFLADVQAKLRDQAKSLAQRMQSRELSQANEEFNGFVTDMNAAAEAMGPASEKLQQQKWTEALPSEQKALQHLLRAEATFRQIQVAFGGRGGGGGGGGAGRDLASLFDLELDTEKNQYETAQTAGSKDQRAKEIDDALQKLDELARRQQELAQQPRNNSQTSQQRWQQEMLRREAEELQKQMQQMAANNSQGGSQSGSQSSSSSASGGQSKLRRQTGLALRRRSPRAASA